EIPWDLAEWIVLSSRRLPKEGSPATWSDEDTARYIDVDHPNAIHQRPYEPYLVYRETNPRLRQAFEDVGSHFGLDLPSSDAPIDMARFLWAMRRLRAPDDATIYRAVP